MPLLSEVVDFGGPVLETQVLARRRASLTTAPGYDPARAKHYPFINQYAVLEQVGIGQHGTVHKAVDTNKRMSPHQIVAIKKLPRQNKKTERLQKLRAPQPSSSQRGQVVNRVSTYEEKILKEIGIMKKCNHPNIVRLIEVINDPLSRKIYIVMEYLGGGEVKWMTPGGKPFLSIEQTRRIMRDALLGVEYLHSQGIIHRDIKPANLLWTEDRSQVKIADFGVSHLSIAEDIRGGNLDSKNVFDELSKMAGTPAFLAPELVYIPPDLDEDEPHTERQRPPITQAIDIWALGVTMYCLLFGSTPFDAKDPNIPKLVREQQLYAAIRSEDWKVPDTMGCDCVPTGGRYPEEGSEGYVIIHLLDHLMEKDSTKRIELEEIKNYCWFTKDVTNFWLRAVSPSSTPEPSEPVSKVWRDTLTRILHPLRSDKRRSVDRSRLPRERDRVHDRQSNFGTRSVPSSRSHGMGTARSHDERRVPPSRKSSNQTSPKVPPANTRRQHTNHDRQPQQQHDVHQQAGSSRETIEYKSYPSRAPSEHSLAANLWARASRVSQVSTGTAEERPQSRLSRFTSWITRTTSRHDQQSPPLKPSRVQSSMQLKGKGKAVPEQTARSHEYLSHRYRDANATPAPTPSTPERYSAFERRATSWGELPNDAASVETAVSELDIQSQLIGAGGVGALPEEIHHRIVQNTNRGEPHLRSFDSSDSSFIEGSSTPQPHLAHVMLSGTTNTGLPSVPHPAPGDAIRASSSRQHRASPLTGPPVAAGTHNLDHDRLVNGSYGSNGYYDSDGSDDSDLENGFGDHFEECDDDDDDDDDGEEDDEEDEDDVGSESDEALEIRTRRHVSSPHTSPPPLSP